MRKINHLTLAAPNLFLLSNLFWLTFHLFNPFSLFSIQTNLPLFFHQPFSMPPPLQISTAHHLLQQILSPQWRPIHLCWWHYVLSSSLSFGLQLGNHLLQTRNHGIWPQEFRIHREHLNQPSPPPKRIHQSPHLPSPSINHLQPMIQHLRRLHQARLVWYPLHCNILGISGNWTTSNAPDRTHWWSIWYPTKQCSDPQETPITNQHRNHLFYWRRRQLWWYVCRWKSHWPSHAPSWRHLGVQHWNLGVVVWDFNPSRRVMLWMPFIFFLFLFSFASNPSDSVITLSLSTLSSSDFPMPPLLPYGFYI